MAAVMTTSPLELQPVEHVAPRRSAGSPPQLRLVTAPPRPAVQVRRRPSAAVYRRRRLAVGLAVAALVLVAAQAAAALGGSPLATPERRPSAPQTFVVQPGDSLWSIARRIQPTGDPRPVVDALARSRHGEPLVAGERIAWGG